MTNEELLARISRNPAVMTGKPVIRGTRLTVDFVVGLMASGATVAEILGEYGGLSEEDVRACLLFASRAVESSTFLPLVLAEAG